MHELTPRVLALSSSTVTTAVTATTTTTTTERRLISPDRYPLNFSRCTPYLRVRARPRHSRNKSLVLLGKFASAIRFAYKCGNKICLPLPSSLFHSSSPPLPPPPLEPTDVSLILSSRFLVLSLVICFSASLSFSCLLRYTLYLKLSSRALRRV